MSKTITKEYLKQKIDNNESFALIEVLDKEDYDSYHIKGAINIPLSTIGKEAKKRFNKEDEIIVYCNDQNCQASPVAAEKLEKLGFSNVYDYEGGKKEWKNAGYPVESS